jgi:hypothetical protein
MVDYRLHAITWKNVNDYNWLRLQITITPCLAYNIFSTQSPHDPTVQKAFC